MRPGLRNAGAGARARQAPPRRGSLTPPAQQRTRGADADHAEAAVQRKPGLAVAGDVWFETVAIAQQRAKRRLPKSVYAALVAATEKGLTVSDNVAAFSELGFAPHVVGAIEKRDLSTTG